MPCSNSGNVTAASFKDRGNQWQFCHNRPVLPWDTATMEPEPTQHNSLDSLQIRK